jgi:hypothetical protein
MWRQATRGQYHAEKLDQLLASQGLLTASSVAAINVYQPLWQLYSVGLLFGQGFDTSTEVGLLELSPTATGGLATLATIPLPILFAAARRTHACHKPRPVRSTGVTPNQGDPQVQPRPKRHGKVSELVDQTVGPRTGLGL